MSANRANIDWHLMHMIGGRPVPKLGESGYVPGAVAIKSTGSVGLGLYVNRGTKESCDFRGTDGQSPILAGGEEQGLYEVSTTQNYLLGAREARPDGRVYRYGKAGTALNPQRAANNYNRHTAAANVTALVAGGTSVDILLTATTSGDTWFGVANNMVGGFYLQPDGTNAQMRGIKSHPAGADGETIDVELDEALAEDIVASAYTEWIKNPYSDLRTDSNHMSCMGIPNVTFASGEYGWFQTWGPRYIAPNAADVGSENAGSRHLVFHAGNVGNRNDLASGQLAGFIIGRTTAGSWTMPPIVMLQISP